MLVRRFLRAIAPNVQVGSRLGVAFSAGLVDLLLQAPTLPWRTDPWNTRELLTFQMGIRL